MAGSLGNYLENALLNHVFGKASYTPPTIYVAVSTTDPLEDGSGITEPSGNGYLRVATAAGDWTTSTAGTLHNGNALVFPKATGSWGTLYYFALYDATKAVGGNMLAHGSLDEGKTIGNNDTLQFPASALVVNMD